MRRLIVATAALSLFMMSAGPAVAQTATPASTAAASELLDAMQMGTRWKGELEQNVDAQTRLTPALAPYKDVLADFFDKYAGWSLVRTEFVSVYASNFTESELRDMIAFYKTPTGQKAIAVAPAIEARARDIGLRIVMTHQSELADAVRQRMAQQSGTPSATSPTAPASPGTAVADAAPAAGAPRDHLGDPDPDPAPLTGPTIFSRPAGMPTPVRLIAPKSDTLSVSTSAPPSP